jgi:hypothetical protein
MSTTKFKPLPGSWSWLELHWFSGASLPSRLSNRKASNDSSSLTMALTWIKLDLMVPTQFWRIVGQDCQRFPSTTAPDPYIHLLRVVVLVSEPCPETPVTRQQHCSFLFFHRSFQQNCIRIIYYKVRNTECVSALYMEYVVCRIRLNGIKISSSSTVYLVPGTERYDSLLRRLHRATGTVIDDIVHHTVRCPQNDVTMTKFWCHLIICLRCDLPTCHFATAILIPHFRSDTRFCFLGWTTSTDSNDIFSFHDEGSVD